MQGERRSVFITGGSGYLGRPLISMLLERGHDVRALVRQGSEKKLPPGCTPVFGDALRDRLGARRVIGLRAAVETFLRAICSV